MGGPQDEPFLAGTSVRDTRAAIEQIFGREVVERGLASVPETLRSEYRDAVPLRWVSYETVRQVHEAIAREAGITSEAMLRKAVPLAVERSFGTVWRTLLRLTGDEALIARTPLMYSRSRSKGQMHAKRVGPGRGVAEVTGFAAIPDRDLISLSIGIAKILEIARRQNVRVDYERTPDGARFHISFDPR